MSLIENYLATDVRPHSLKNLERLEDASGLRLRARLNACRGLRGLRDLMQAEQPGAVTVAEGMNIPKLPFDVHYEIFRHCQPLDLLHLARTSKTFRRILMSRRSESIWTSAHANVDFIPLPACPSFMSEPRLATLAFEQQCDMCGEHTELTANRLKYGFRVRFCSACEHKLVVVASTDQAIDLARFGAQHTSIPYYELFVPAKYHGGVLLGAPYSPEMETSSEYYRADVEHLISLIDEATTIEQCAAIIENWNATTQQILQHSRALYHWAVMSREVARGWESHSLRKFIPFLRLLGYSKEVDFVGPYSERWSTLLDELLHVIRGPDLTDNAVALSMWEKIAPEVIVFIKQFRPMRIAWGHMLEIRSRLPLLKTVLKQHLTRVLHPHPRCVDLLYCDGIRAVLEQPCDIAHAVKAAFEHVLPDAIESWQQSVKAELNALASELPAPQREPVELARTLFRCTCGKLLAWPEVGEHLHMNTAERAPEQPEQLDALPGTPYDKAVRPLQDAHDGAWTPNVLVPCTGRAGPMFTACGEDAAHVTPAQMDALGARLACGLCGTPGTSMLVMGWRKALHHCNTSHLLSDPAALQWRTVHAENVFVHPMRSVWLISDRVAVKDLPPWQQTLLKSNDTIRYAF